MSERQACELAGVAVSSYRYRCGGYKATKR